MADYTGVLVDLRTRRDALLDEVSGLNTAIAAIEKIVTSSKQLALPQMPPPREASSGIQAGVYRGLTMKQALRRHLELHGRDRILSTRDLTKAVITGGYVSRSAKLSTVVYNNLVQMSEGENPIVVKDGSGWRLAQ